MPLDIPQTFRHHVFCCAQQRPPGHPRGSCAAKGAHPLWQRLDQKILAKGLADVGMAMTGCLGFCSAGPLMVIYPDGIWYRPETPEDIDEIVESHLVNDTPVERLVMVLTR